MGKLVPEPITTPQALAANLSNEGGIGNIRLLKNCRGGWLVHELRRALRDALPIIKQAFPIKEFKPANTVAWDQAYACFQKLV